MGIVFQVQIEGVVFSTYTKHLYDDETFPLFCRLLKDRLKDSTFSILEKAWSARWCRFYDTVFPYGDRRECHHETVWIFDLDNDVLFFTKADTAGEVPLSLLRERLITSDDFSPCSPPHAPQFELEKNFSAPYWDPVLHPSPREKVFIRRLLDDFNHQWRHVLRNRYNDVTFQQLVTAILRLATSDFEIVELSRARYNLVVGGPNVPILTLPTWNLGSWDCRQIIRVGRVWIVATQDPADAIPLIRQHFNAQTRAELKDHTGGYLILSVRHIILCHVQQNQMRWTASEPFLNGDGTPCSDRAMDLLLSAISPLPNIKNKSQSPLQNLPIEIQDQILAHVSRGPVEAARLGCILGLGSPFLWLDGKQKIQREEVRRMRSEFSFVESQVWFGEHMSGVSYKP